MSAPFCADTRVVRSIKGAKIGAIEAADFCTDPGAGGESLTPKRPELQRLLANLEAPSGWGSSYGGTGNSACATVAEHRGGGAF
jgi:hypothetical protein